MLAAVLIMAVAAVIIAFAAGGSAGKGGNGAPEYGRGLSRGVKAHGNGPVGEFFGMIARELGLRESRDLARDVNEDLLERHALAVNPDAVMDEANEIRLPYRTEEERRDVLRRLRDGERLFADMIKTAEENIQRARVDGSRSDDEIREADDAVNEMNRGRRFIADRIGLVEGEKGKK